MPAPRARANDKAAAPAINLVALRQSAQRSALRASEAAGDAKRASLATQKASEEAANLALRVFITDHDTPKASDSPAAKASAATPAAPDDVPVATPTRPEVQGRAPIANNGKAQAAPAARPQTEDAN